ncbi:MAG: LysR family transcriptional regulator [Alphaproteobacteria bacterium]|nr:LysR family transcriptional regulator [Alphaproteobacteria bacterium]MBU2083635.1 LysR family transcriptional regulator [Alphaproteobacteria bacterium]MBU2143280.1 LysR family transcriptional regulator [Alphaproteobacteria bacterium]MBU2195101.1 LysR family transcriptional regulator [Alphaproteobacteria bacterium]
MSSERLNWDNLRVFMVVAELNSMKAASVRLGDSPPTIGRKIDELETELNVQLLNRSTRGVELTEAGKFVLSQAKAMADAANGLRRQTDEKGQPIEGSITLATGDGLGPYWIAPRLPEFNRANPRIQIKMNVFEKAPDVGAGEADIAIQYTEPKQHDVIARRMGTLHYISFASREYLDEHGEPNSLFEYFRHRTILHQAYVHQIERWAPKMSELRKMVNFAFVTNSASAMIEVCKSGGGVALLPSYIGTVEPTLVPLELPEVAPIQFWLTYTERVWRMPSGRIVIDWLKDMFEAEDAFWFTEHFVHPNRANAVKPYLQGGTSAAS